MNTPILTPELPAASEPLRAALTAAWLRDEDEAVRALLGELQLDAETPGEFLEFLKLDLYQDEIFVFTPTGDVIQLPKGATPSTSGAPTSAVPLDRATEEPNQSTATPSPATSFACRVHVTPLRVNT